MSNAGDVERICLAALERPASERAAFLAEACREDAALLKDVESLLAHASPAEQFFDRPAVEGSDALMGLSGLSVGQRLGPYQIIAKLGAGGMGEVYRARDTQLGREVAIKILPVVFAVDPDRLARFEREARVLATLNHPHIAAIYGIETTPAEAGHRVRALVMELVEGVTLAERIARGPLPVAEALAVAVQIADALDAAHGYGIIHRDVKPANIKITPAGVAKVLDFGLAKLADPVHHESPTPSTSASLSPTVATPALITGEDALLGTAAYMSPEQAKRLPADKRADIWAFGVVLYEMLTGRRGFDGDTTVEVLSHVLTADPEWGALPPQTPPAVRSLLRRCLQKDPSRRLRDIGDARFQIEEGLGEPVGAADAERGPAAVSGAPRQGPWWVAALIVASAAAVAVSLWFSRRQAPDPEEVRLEITAPPTTEPTSIALSPDGKVVVFVATTDRQSRLWVRPLNAVSAKPLAGTENARLPFWSPDSRSVGFAADGQLKRVDIESGVVRVLASGGALGGAWNRDGTILFDRVPGPGLWRVSAEGGAPREVLRGTAEANDQWSPQFLPDHRHYLFYATGTAPGIYGGNLDTSESPRRIVDAQSAAYASSGHLLFVRNGTLFAQAFDPVRLVLAGSPVVLAEHVVEGAGVGATAALSGSAPSSFIYRARPSTAQNQFVWFDRSGTAQETVPGFDGFDALNGALSPDGSRLALVGRDATTTTDIWVLDVKRGIPTRLTFDSAFDMGPAWSPDGHRIAFTSNRRGPSAWALYMKSADGTGKDEILVALEGSGGGGPNDWSPDGRFLLYEMGRGGHRDILALPLKGDRKPVPVVATPFHETGGKFSPDGKWIAFQSDESGRPQIYVQPFLRPGPKVRISTAGGVQARWRRDGQELFYVAPDQRLMAVPIQFNAELPNGVNPGAPAALLTTSLSGNYSVSRDGQRFLVATRSEVTIPITVVLNWKPKS